MKQTRYILSCDSGGVNGIATITFLCELEKYLMEHEGKTLYDKFDMFAGSSIGGAIAMLIGATNKRCEEIKTLFSKENMDIMMDSSCWDKIFDILQTKPKYDGVGKDFRFA